MRLKKAARDLFTTWLKSGTLELCASERFLQDMPSVHLAALKSRQPLKGSRTNLLHRLATTDEQITLVINHKRISHLLDLTVLVPNRDFKARCQADGAPVGPLVSDPGTCRAVAAKNNTYKIDP